MARLSGAQVRDRPGRGEIEWVEPGSVDSAPRLLVDPFGAGSEAVAPAPARLWADGHLTAAGARYRAFRQEFLSGHRPRRQSRVRRVVHQPLSATVDLVDALLAGRGLVVGAGPLIAEPQGRRLRAAGRLHVPWSYPSLPIWLVVEPWWRDQSMVSIGLRTRRRWRYPVRYYRTAHGVLDQVASSASGSSSAGEASHQASS